MLFENILKALSRVELVCFTIVCENEVLEARGSYEEEIGGGSFGANLCKHCNSTVDWPGALHYQAIFCGYPYFYPISFPMVLSGRFEAWIWSLMRIREGSYPSTRHSCSGSSRHSLIAYRTLLGLCMGAMYDILDTIDCANCGVGRLICELRM